MAELKIRLDVLPGELHVVKTSCIEDSAAISDGLMGLSGRGDVRFLDATWQAMASSQASRQRSLVGRVPARGSWLEDRSVLENVLLPLRHHTVLKNEVLEERAVRLAMAFHLPGIPLLRPQHCLDVDLVRAAWVRAFLGRPKLVILEHPTNGAEGAPLEPLLAQVQHVCRRGGGVVWFTRRDDFLPALVGVKHHRVTGHRLIALKWCELPGQDTRHACCGPASSTYVAGSSGHGRRLPVCAEPHPGRGPARVAGSR